MIFLDTSAIYALASRSDANHATARKKFAAILDDGISIATHNYVLVESFALLQHRLGLPVAAKFNADTRHFDVEWVTPEIHGEAARRWELGAKHVSFVDHVSFLVMQLRGISVAFAFDDDFAHAGFRIY